MTHAHKNFRTFEVHGRTSARGVCRLRRDRHTSVHVDTIGDDAAALWVQYETTYTIRR